MQCPQASSDEFVKLTTGPTSSAEIKSGENGHQLPYVLMTLFINNTRHNLLKLLFLQDKQRHLLLIT
jgi:hypothetical protein